jgi:hypothetical protein
MNYLEPFSLISSIPLALSLVAMEKFLKRGLKIKE